MAQNFDRRRINGPENSAPPVFEDEDEDASPYAKWATGQPRIGRAADDIRPIFMKPGLITQANGSVYLETERIKLVCAVYGPRQAKGSTYSDKGRLHVEAKFAPFSCARRRVPIRDAEDRSVASAVHQALVPAVRLELFPKSTIEVFITVLDNDGMESCVSAATLAASAALADAGIEMMGLVASCTASLVGDEAWLDPTEDEIRLGGSTITLACIPALDTITSVSQSGRIPPLACIQIMETCQARCSDIHSVVAQSLLEAHAVGDSAGSI